MKKLFSIATLVFFLIPFSHVFSHVEHYKSLKLLKYGLYFNDKLIGQHTFEFNKKGDFLYVRGAGNFVVNKLGVSLFDFKTVSEEVFKKGKLIKFSSKTTQNKKQKFCNIKLENNKLLIEGSSYNGIAESNLPVGTWWNHEIIKFSKQISPISGRLLPQKVNFLGKKDIIINEKPFKSIHFYFLSDDDRPNDKKKLNINIWYDQKSLLWIKSSYEKFGLWEYRLLEVK